MHDREPRPGGAGTEPERGRAVTAASMTGILNPDGTFRARRIAHDGYPAWQVPALTRIVHVTYGGDVAHALGTLLARNWDFLNARQGEGSDPATGIPAVPRVGQPAADDRGLYTGKLVDQDGAENGLEWAYLFTREATWTLTAYHAERTADSWFRPHRWQAAASWPADRFGGLGAAQVFAAIPAVSA